MPALWSKIYRRELFGESLCHYPMPMGQDLLLNLQIGCRVARVRIIDYVGYNYLQRAGSSIHRNKLTFDYCKKFAECVDDIFARNAGAVAPERAEFLSLVSGLWWYVGYISKSSNSWRGSDEFAKKLHEMAPRYRKALRTIFRVSSCCFSGSTDGGPCARRLSPFQRCSVGARVSNAVWRADKRAA